MSIIIKESTLRRLIRESLFTELQAYHGSQSDFDKFNHKKYLSNGAGSQVFGWGTYVTDDEVIAKDYANLHDIGEHDYRNYIYFNGGEYRENDFYLIGDEFVDWMKTNQSDLYKDFADIYRSNPDNAISEIITSWVEQYAKKEFTTQDMLEIIKEINYQNENSVENKMFSLLVNSFYHFVQANEILTYYKPKHKIVYEVNIPDDNGVNYISWYDPLTEEQKNIIYKTLSQIYTNHPKAHNIRMVLNSIKSDNGWNNLPFQGIYKSLENYLHSDKAASLLLLQCGFTGIKYQTGTLWVKPEGAKEEGCNYVIFNANDVQIVNKTNI